MFRLKSLYCNNSTVSPKTHTLNLIKHSTLSDKTKTSLITKNPVPPRLCDLPKIHKINVPFRPIVSAINSPTYKLARFLVKKLGSLTDKNHHTIKNFLDFIEEIKGFRLKPDDILVIFDVVLFTKVPISDMIETIKFSKQVFSDLISLIEYCLASIYFSYNGNFYK